jgi:hypothetical protein
MQVTRRQFVAATLGGLLLPSIRLDLSHERDLSQLVNEFCDTEEYRQYDIRQPWECEGDSVASDSRALIRVPGLHYVPEGRDVRVPNASMVFKSFWRESGWLPLPQERRMRGNYNYCPYCSRNECPQCNGLGEMWVDDYSVAGLCSRCLGSGYTLNPDCDICHGTPDQQSVAWLDRWGDQAISVRYARLLRQIPGARWLPGVGDEEHPILVRGDGGIRAMVMPVLKD